MRPRHDDPSNSRPELNLESYLAARDVLVSFSKGFHGTVDHALLSLQKDRQVVATVPHFLTAMAIAGSSDCVTTVPRRVAEYYEKAFYFSVHTPPFEIGEFSLSAATHGRRKNDLGLAWFVATVQRLWVG
jgi:DNA-binding transcriptional LysR family regulator